MITGEENKTSGEGTSNANGADWQEAMKDVKPFTGESSEQRKKPSTVYNEIATRAFEKWYGLSSKEAADEIKGKEWSEIDGKVGAFNSIHAAIDGIMTYLPNSDWENEWYEKHGYDTIYDGSNLIDAIFDGKEADKTFDFFKAGLEKVENKEEFVLNVLNGIHRQWIQDNESKLNDPARVQKRYQFLPLSLIGFEEAKADLLFLEPILNAGGMEVNEEKLKEAYDNYYDEAPRGVKQIIQRKEGWDDDESDFLLSKLKNWKIGRSAPEIAVKIAETLNNGIDLNNKTMLWRRDIDFWNTEDHSPIVMVDRDTGEETTREPNESDQRARYCVEVARQAVDRLKPEK